MSKPRKRNELLTKMAVDLYEKLGSGNEVAKRLDVAPRTVYQMLHDAGLHIPGWKDEKPTRRKFSPDVEANVVADYLAGLSWDAMESKYGKGQYAIRAAVKRAGHKLRDHGGQRRRVYEDEFDRIVKLYTEDMMSQAQIAVLLKCHQTVVSNVLRQRKIKTRKHRLTHNWKGGISKTGGGYILEHCVDDPVFSAMATRSGYVMQHRLVMARHLGRPLRKSETVHHINGNIADNRIENLQLRHGKHGKGEVLCCADCGSHNIIHKAIT